MAPRRVSQADDSFSGGNTDESSGDDSSLYTPPTLTSSKKRRKSSSSHSSANRSNHPHIVTKHNYHDHSIDPIYDVVNDHRSESSTPGTSCSSRSTPSAKGGTTMPFPIKLYEMLTQVEEDGLAHVVSWQPHGRCFVVHDPVAFKALLPNFFKLSKIASFQRQLNLYGFQRLTVGKDKGSYYNELFLRGRPDLVMRIHRVKVKGTGVRAKSNPKEEPDLYIYPAVDNLAASALARVQDGSTEVGETTTEMQFSSPRSILSSDVVPRSYTSVVEDTDNKLGDTSISGVTNGNIRPMPMLFFSHPSRDSTSAAMVESRMRSAQSLLDLSASGTGSIAPHVSGSDGTKTAPEETWDGNVAKSDVSFDRLIDEMFGHNQSLDFSDLLKLAAV